MSDKTTTVTYRKHYTTEEYDSMGRVSHLRKWTVDYETVDGLTRDWDEHGMARPDDRWVEIVTVTMICTKVKLPKKVVTSLVGEKRLAEAKRLVIRLEEELE